MKLYTCVSRYFLPLLCLVSLFACPGLHAQASKKTVREQAPTPPPGVPVPPLPAGPLYYKTAEGMDIKVTILARGLNHPFGFASLPDGTLLVSERDKGRLRVIRNGVLDPQPVAGLPPIKSGPYKGLLDIVPHPDYATNHLLYLTYDKPVGKDSIAVAVMRATWDGQRLRNAQDIFVADPGDGGSSRLMFDHQGLLYVSIYGSKMDAQDLSGLRGKVLRLTDDGQVPPDNPFIHKAGARPEIYTYGHRTIQGMVQDPRTGQIWSLEMGPNGGDEVNILKPGANYGWPIVSLGRDYPGPWQSKYFQKQGYEDPIIFWMPAISPSGMTFYTGDKLKKWQGDLLVGGLRMGEIPGTGHLERIRFNAKGEEIRRELLLMDLRLRIRGAYQGLDGYLYVLADEDNGALLKIGPAE